MRHVLIRAQLVVVSVLLLATFSIVMALVMRYNKRWDVTKEKIYSLSVETKDVLARLEGEPIEVIAFYPNDDPARANFELFLKECKMYHPAFTYNFYDPDRVPNLAKKFKVTEFYTVIIRFGTRTEQLVGPTEESMTNAFMRLANPKRFSLCFTTAHDESPVNSQGRNGLSQFRHTLENYNYGVHEVILLRDKVPPFCDVVVVAGPHREFDPEEFKILKDGFKNGLGIFFLIDPMDPGTGRSFKEFMAGFGVALGEDVVVDKMSRVVGGDFLIPLVGQYVAEHPITARFNQTTFFPVARSVQPSSEEKSDLEVVPLALSGSGSWAESDLVTLEKGEAAFASASDVAGPICLSVAVESRPGTGGRMVVVGDSDFITDSYLALSGNSNLALSMVRWLARDDRFVSIRPREPEFKPLFLNARQRFKMVGATVVVMPGAALLLGAVLIIMRRKTG